jgi:hypothetical protein
VGEDLLAQDVGVAEVLSQLAGHVEVDPPERSYAAALDDVLKGQGDRVRAGRLADVAIGGLDGGDRVVSSRVKERSGVEAMPIST